MFCFFPKLLLGESMLFHEATEDAWVDVDGFRLIVVVYENEIVGQESAHAFKISLFRPVVCLYAKSGFKEL